MIEQVNGVGQPSTEAKPRPAVSNSTLPLSPAPPAWLPWRRTSSRPFSVARNPTVFRCGGCEKMSLCSGKINASRPASAGEQAHCIVPLSDPAAAFGLPVGEDLIQVRRPKHLPLSGAVVEVHAHRITEPITVVQGDGPLLLPTLLEG